VQAAKGAADREAALTIVNAMPEIERAARWLDGLATTAPLPTDLTEKLQVVLDEILSNVIRHGLRDAPEGSRDIALMLRLTPGCLMLEVVDDAPAFDPTVSPPVESATRLATRQVGGVGLLMVRRLIDKSRYSRDGGHNRLTLWKYLSG
jgi:anti-sigma regulatory factor (Ser/Thr protein kinase)